MANYWCDYCGDVDEPTTTINPALCDRCKTEECAHTASSLPTMETMKTKFELLQILRSHSIDDIIENYPGQPGHILESMGKLAVAFRCPTLPFVASSMSACRSDDGYVPITNYTQGLLLKNLNTSSEDGASDITFRIFNELTTIFISSKYFEKDNRALADWDINGLHAIKDKHVNPKMGVLTRDKAIFKKRYDSATTKGRCDPDILERVFDIGDLKNAVPHILRTCDLCAWNIDEISRYLSNTNLKTLSHPYHQKLALSLIAKMDLNSAILLALKCRFGKSYVMAGLIAQHGFKRVMIVTPIPNETTEQLASMFDEYIEFSGYTRVIMNKVAKKVPTGNVIYIVSKQWLDTHRNIALGDLDAVFSDENHFAGVTDISKDHMLKHVRPGKTAFFAVTGTGTKSQIGFAIPSSQTVTWGFQHDQLCKENNIKGLVEDFGDDARTCAVGHDLPKEYSEIPKLVVLGPATQPALIKRICENPENANVTFDLSEVLEVNGAGDAFKNPGKVNGLLIHHFGDGSNQETCIMDRISRMGSRTGQRGSPTIQLFFLPVDNIDARAKCLKKLMEDEKGPSYAKNYLVEFITSETPGLMSKVGFRKHMTNLLEKAANDGKKKGGVVVLLGKIGSLGVTVEKADIVVMLNNTKSFDWYIQALSRALSEDKGANKKYGFLVDYNQQRVLELCRMIGDNRHVMRGEGEGVMRSVLKNATKIIDIDPDQMVNHERSEWITDLLFKWWKSSDMNRMDVIAERLRQLANSVELGDDMIAQLRQYITKSSTRLHSTRETSEMHDASQKMPAAKAGEMVSAADKKIEEILIDPNWAEEIITTIPTFASLCTLRGNSCDVIEMLEKIDSDEHLSRVFSTHCANMWAGSANAGFIHVIKSIFKSCDIHIIREINQSVEMFKEEMQSALIHNPTLALRYLIAAMVPKQHEREENGEVYTPFEIVDMILDKLPQNIWKNPHSTFFDQSVGLGNFMVRIYERLMKGLAQVIPNHESRMRHIIKNQLFMSEFNVKNVFVCKMVFGEDCNIHEGDTLLLDVKEKWGIEKFTVVGFNPPYNKNGIRSSKGDKMGTSDEPSETIWPKFVQQAHALLEDGGYTAFIHPLGWLKSTYDVHDLILSKHVVWLLLWDNIRAKADITAKIPLSIYIMRNVKSSPELLTDVSADILSKKLKQTSRLYLDPTESIPIAYHEILSKIKRKITDHPELAIAVSTKVVKPEGTRNALPAEYSADDMLAVDTYTIKNGYAVFRTKSMHPDANKHKLIIANKSSFAGVLVDDGRLGIVGSDKVYILGDDTASLNRLKSVFDTKLGAVIAHYTKYRQDFLDRSAYKYIPDVRNIPVSEMPEITDAALAEYFNFTDEEKASLNM